MIALLGANSERAVDKVIRRLSFNEYDLVYFMAGINNLSYKILRPGGGAPIHPSQACGEACGGWVTQ